MSRSLLLPALIALSGALCGCAAYGQYRACAAGGCPQDAAVSAAVRAALYRHAELRAPNAVYVQTLDGVVYLSGIVSTELQRDIAASAASEVPGARRVVNGVALEYTGR